MDEQKRILIVEDDVVLRDVLAGKLVKNDYIVDRAEDGVIALEKMRAIKPDCVLMDILMPRKGGIEVMEEMHKDSELKDIPIIVISNSGQPVEIKRAQELGARDFLIKAVFDPNEVLEKVRNIFEEKDKQGQADFSIRTQNVVGGGSAQGAPTADTVVAPSTPPTTPAPAPSTSTSPKKFILVVEDDKFLRELLVRKLVAEGFDVKNAIDAEMAFTALSERMPDIILLDLILPGVDGFEILARVKANPKLISVPVIILSNLGQKEDLDKAMALGAKDFMVKANFTLDEIVAKVHTEVG